MPNLDEILHDQFTIIGVNDDGVPFWLDCGVYAVHYEAVEQWAFPVGGGQYPPEMWYAATVHDITGVLNNGYKHTGLDLNLDVAPHGDIERRLGLAVYSVSDGYVSYLTEAWSGVPMLVVHTAHFGAPLYIRYAHIIPTVLIGQSVKAGQTLGSFADWGSSALKGDHLHMDMATDPFTREWLNTSINWVDPVAVLSAHLDPQLVNAMCKRG